MRHPFHILIVDDKSVIKQVLSCVLQCKELYYYNLLTIYSKFSLEFHINFILSGGGILSRRIIQKMNILILLF